jgi:HTH-type transcriptional regulator, cell division transcriptional repressor
VPDTATIYSTDQDLDTIGGRISRARDATGLSVAQLARRLGVKSSTMQGWESDRAQPRANRLAMLAGILGVSPAWMLHGIGSAPDEEGSGAERARSVLFERLKRLHNETADVIAEIERGMQDGPARAG